MSDIQAAQNIVLFDALEEILRWCQREAVPVIVLKGAALAEELYGDISLRPMSDLDLLIPEADLPRFKEYLLSTGFHPLYKSRATFTRGERFPVLVDLHTYLFYLEALSINELFQRARPAVIAGVETRVLSREDTLLYLIVHLMLSHGYPHPKWLKDIDLLVRRYQRGPSPTLRHSEERSDEESQQYEILPLRYTQGQNDAIDWDLLLNRIQQVSLAVPAYFVLEKVSSEYGTPVPPRVLNDLKPKRWSLTAFLCQWIMKQNKPVIGIDYVLPVLARPGIKSKIALLCQSLFPSKETMTLRYQIKHPSLVYFYYVIRFFSLILKGLAGLIRMIVLAFKKIN